MPTELYELLNYRVYPVFMDTPYITVRRDVADELYTKKDEEFLIINILKIATIKIHFLDRKDIEIENHSIFSTINHVSTLNCTKKNTSL